jgi:sulfite reductase (ferredoxin)
LLTREITAEAAQDIAKFEEQLASYLAGDLDEDVFRVFRLNNGIYGQRQGGHNQMVRIKAPYGHIEPDQLEMIAHVAEEHSRGWAHITTRQNYQIHFVQLEQIPEVMRKLASVGLTTREACGDTVRNVMGCHLAGACPFEVFDISPWAEATFQYFLRNPLAQRLPRKFKINFSGCTTDCGQAMFNDVGVVAVSRPREGGGVEHGFRVYLAGGLGANPHPALALEDFTPKEELLPTIEALLRVFDQNGNRDNKLRARMKWLVDTLGFDELQRKVFQIRRFLLASATWPGGHPRRGGQTGRRSGGPVVHGGGDAHGPRHAGGHLGHLGLRPLGCSQRRAGRSQGHGVGLRLVPPG